MSNELRPDPSLDDPVLGVLATARPGAATDDTPDTPDARVLLAEILALAPAPLAPARANTRRVRIGAGALSAAAAVAVAVAVAVMIVNSVGVDHGRVVVQQQPAAADVAAIARASAGAFASSGRAVETFDVGPGSVTEQRGTSQVAFSGSNLDVVQHFDGVAGRPGFDVHNITVDQQFYLEDGPPGAKKWYHDTTATPSGSEIFDLDPRSLLSVLRPAAGFVVVDTTSGPGGAVRHLRATELAALPSQHVSLGAVDGRDITSLDLWVGTDDTVQRLVLTAKHTESATPCFVQDGVKQCLNRGDKLQKIGDRMKIVRGAGPAVSVAPVTTIGTYSVRFTDIGARISITAPTNAVTVAGKG